LREITVREKLTHIALDLFSGHGWGVALNKLGVHEYAVDNMPEVNQTRLANGMSAVTYENVWDVDKAEGLVFDTLIASPPCQTFSTANSNGTGRQALDQIIALIKAKAYKSVDELRAAGEELGDDRTALVLAPLHYIHRFLPEYVVLEQVPTVLPVWEAYKPVLEELGYNVWTGVLKAEQYGVPQTRKRAILLASKHTTVSKPEPTHSQYFNREPYRLDAGLPSWVSIEDALGRQEIPTTGEKVNYLKLGKQKGQAIRRVDTPAPTLAFGNDHGTPRWFNSRDHADAWKTFPEDWIHDVVDKFSLEEAGVLQSYPKGFTFEGNTMLKFRQIANSVPPVLAEAILKEVWK
jgi:DNA (cytosine-5)-methyltransferase 1